MKTHTHRKPAHGKAGPRPVCFEFEYPTAGTPGIAGTFNDWNPRVTRMISPGPGRGRKELTQPQGSDITCLVVDGAWRPDLEGVTAPHPSADMNTVGTVRNEG